MQKLDLTICEASEAVGLVSFYDLTSIPYHAVISIEHPGAVNITTYRDGRSPAAQGRAPRLAEEVDPAWKDRQLILTCWDTEFEYDRGIVPPDKTIVTDALAFLKKLAAEYGEPLRVLIHCQAGKSRSTGLALVLLNQVNKMEPREAVKELLLLRPIASPNLAIVRHGENGEALIEAVLEQERVVARRMLHVGQNPALKVRPKEIKLGD